MRKIAVLRAGGLGDLMFALPAVDALRAAYPAAEIVLLGSAWHAEFLGGRPGAVDRVIVLPAVPGVTAAAGRETDSSEVERAIGALEAEGFDLALQIHGGGRHSNPFLIRLGARLTAGLRTADSAELDRSVPYVYYQSEVFRALEVANLVGAPAIRLEPRVAVTEGDVAEAVEVLHGRSAGRSAGGLAVLHPGAGDPRRRWPARSFAAVGDGLAAEGHMVAITGSAGDRQLVREVAEAMDTPAIDLAGALSLGGLAGLLSIGSVVVSNDSGPLHLALAVGAPTVGIFWCGNLINAGPLWRRRHRPAISWRLDCPRCGRDCTREACDHPDSFVAGVPVEEVLGSARELAARSLRGKERAGRAPAEPVGTSTA